MWNNEQEARAQIKSLVCEYYNQFKNQIQPLKMAIESPMQVVSLMKRNVCFNRCHP